MEDRNFLQSLIKSGIHWGHRRSRRNPKMEPYIWGYKNDVSLIDVSKTAHQMKKAARFLEGIAAEGRNILWVGTKKPAQEAINAIASQLQMPYVSHRWVGGTLSNYAQVKKSVTKLMHYEDVLSKAEKFPHYTKKELNTLQKALDRLKKNIGGIRNLTWPVGAIVLIDVVKEHSALKEAAAMGVPVVAMVDTNSDPSLVNYVIPGNDDAPKAVRLVLDYLAEAAAKGAAVAASKPVENLEGITGKDGIDLRLVETESEEDRAKRRGPRSHAGGRGRSSGRREGGDNRAPRPARKKEAGE